MSVDASSCEATELRCTGLYADWASKMVSANVHQYTPGFALWSDGATETRWIYLPPGQQINTSNMDEWTFPPGTKAWQEFVLGGKRIETRLLWKMADSSWKATIYVWSADESTTTALTRGQVNDAGYEIPTQADCVQCHQGRHDYLLGFEAVSLSSPKAGGLTMSVLVSQGLVSAPPSLPVTIPGTATEAAALGYLHANCGTSCHNVDMSAAATNTSFRARLDVATLSSVQTTDTWTTGWNMPARFPGLAGAPTLLAQCRTASSGVYYRMNHRDGLNEAGPGTQMPPIDTHQIDGIGVETIGAWINEGCADAGPDAASDARRE